jgi:hypothetical protein
LLAPEAAVDERLGRLFAHELVDVLLHGIAPAGASWKP